MDFEFCIAEYVMGFVKNVLRHILVLQFQQ